MHGCLDMKKSQTDEQRFWYKVEKTNYCWNWKLSLDKDGYGRIKVNRKKIGAHRFSYELIKGEIPEGLQLDHICKNKACVNPDHLEAVTCDENIKRAENQVTTINSRKTHCPKGHPYSGDNLFFVKSGHRGCKTCHRQKALLYYHKIKHPK